MNAHPNKSHAIMPTVSHAVAELLGPGQLLICDPQSLELHYATSAAQLIAHLVGHCDGDENVTFVVTVADQERDPRSSPPVKVVQYREADDWFTATDRIAELRLATTSPSAFLHVEASLGFVIWWHCNVEAKKLEAALNAAFTM
jgi:hypothetical protein